MGYTGYKQIHKTSRPSFVLSFFFLLLLLLFLLLPVLIFLLLLTAGVLFRRIVFATLLSLLARVRRNDLPRPCNGRSRMRFSFSIVIPCSYRRDTGFPCIFEAPSPGETKFVRYDLANIYLHARVEYKIDTRSILLNSQDLRKDISPTSVAERLLLHLSNEYLTERRQP